MDKQVTKQRHNTKYKLNSSYRPNYLKLEHVTYERDNKVVRSPKKYRNETRRGVSYEIPLVHKVLDTKI